MKKFIHPNNKTHQSQQSRFSCNGSSQSILTTSRTHSPNSSKTTLMSRSNNPYDSFSPPSIINDADSFKNNLKNCFEMCSAYIQALNSLCSTGSSLAESLGKVFGQNINLTNVKFNPNSHSMQKSSKKCASESDQNAPSYADVLVSGNLDTATYYEMAQKFHVVWYHLSNATAGASATIKTETLFALQDLITKLESPSVYAGDANHHLHNAHQNGPATDQNDPVGTLIDSIQSAKSCLLSYIELQMQFSYSSWKSLNFLSKALKADNSMKDVVRRLKHDFDLQKALSSSPIKQNVPAPDDHINNCTNSLAPGDRVTEASQQAKHSSSDAPSVSSKKKKERTDSNKAHCVDELVLDLLSLSPPKHEKCGEERRRSWTKKSSSKKRSSNKSSNHLHHHRSTQQASLQQSSQHIASYSSGNAQNSNARSSRKQTNRHKSPNDPEEYQKRIEAYNAKQHRTDSSRQAARQESMNALVHLPNLDHSVAANSQPEYLCRLKSQSTSTWPGKAPANVSQPSEATPLVSSVENNYRFNLQDSWSLWPTNLTNNHSSNSNTGTWSVFDQIAQSNGSSNTNSPSATSLGFDPFGNNSALKNARQIFKSTSNSTSTRSSVLPGASINHVLNNNLGTLGDSPSAIGVNRFASLGDYIDHASAAFSNERLARFNAPDPSSPSRLASDSAGIASVLTPDLSVPHQTPNSCTSSSSMTIDPLRMAKTSTWPLKQSPINSTLTNAAAGSSALLHSDGLNDNGNPGPPWLQIEQMQQLISYGLPSEDSHFGPCGQTNNVWSFNGPKDHSTSGSNSSQVINQQSLNNSSNGSSQGNGPSRYSLFETNNNTCRPIDETF